MHPSGSAIAARLRVVPALSFERLALFAASILIIAIVGYPVVSALRLVSFDKVVELGAPQNIQPLLNSLLLAVLTAIPATAIGIPLAWLCSRTDLPGRRLIVMLISVSFALPALLTSIAYVFLFGKNAGLINSWYSGMFGMPLFNIYSFSGVVLVSFLHGFPLVFFTTLAGMSNVNPELEEAGRICGLSPVGVFLRITSGAVTPSIMAGVVFLIAETLTMLAAPLVLGLPVGISFVTTELYSSVVMSPDTSTALAISLPLIGTTLAVLFVQRWFLGAAGSSRFSIVSGKGVRSEPVRLGRWTAIAVMFAWLPVFFALILPTTTLLVAAFTEHWWKALTWQNITFRNFLFLVDDEATRLAVSNSLLLSLGVAATLALLGSSLAILLAGEQTPFKRTLRAVCMAPLGLPHIVAGLLVILAWYGPPFNLGGTIWILALGYALVSIGYAVRTGEASRGQIDQTLAEAGQMIGCSPIRVWWHVLLPLMKQGTATIFILVFLFSIKEFSLTAMVYSAETITLAVRVYAFLEGGSLEKTAAASIVLLALTFLTLFIASKLFNLTVSSLRT